MKRADLEHIIRAAGSIADAPEKADLVDGSIGEKSPFHETFGYYAHGVGPDTAVLPRNWKARLIRVQNDNTNNISGLCISPVDLLISKLAAGREKVLEFVRALLKHKLVFISQVEAIFPELDAQLLSKVKPRLVAAAQPT